MKAKKNFEKCDICGNKEIKMIESLSFWNIDDHICWCENCWKVHEKANEVFEEKYKKSQKKEKVK